MGKKNFDRKKAVRFSLLPGPIVNGKPTVLYKPVQNKKSKVPKKLRKQTISKLADIDEVTINGKVVGQDEIPAYVLQQIRGRGDLIYNQMKGMPKQQEMEGDMYEIQDAKQEDLQYQEYDQRDLELEERYKPIKEQEEHSSNQDEQWEDDDQEWSDVQVEQIEVDDQIKEKKQKFETKVEEFPTIQQTETVNIEGKDYQLTKKQLQILQTVIPQNYEKMDFGGLQFKKYNEDGLLLSQKQKYEKYLLGENQQVVVIDSYEYVPPKPIDTYDNDLLPSQINKDANIKEVQQALNYNGDQVIYEQIEDDFFVKMIQMELSTNPPVSKPKNEEVKPSQPAKQKPVSNPKAKKQAKVQPAKQREAQLTEKQLQQQLKKAVFNFQHNIEDKKDKKQLNMSSDDEEEQPYSHTNHSMNFTDIEKRQEYKGNDGELDWRCLTKKEKKQYMKTKVIQDFYDQLRNRQIEQKLEGKNNVKVEELHLKQLVKHIPYQEDIVMQKSLAQDLKKQVHLSDQDQQAYQSLSDQDDIVSFHQKTSIIASNLSVIQQPRTKAKKQKKEEKDTEEEENNITKVKVVPEKRDKNQTPQERKQRKDKLKQLKKQRKEQKKQFAERFSKIKKETSRSQNTTNPLNKISYVKIY